MVDRREDDGRAWKCTLCYDRLKGDLTPACAKACPTASIQFGELAELRERARAARRAAARAAASSDAYLYGEDAASQPGTEGLHAFFLLVRPARGLQPAARSGGPDHEDRHGAGAPMAAGVLSLAALAAAAVLSARRA